MTEEIKETGLAIIQTLTPMAVYGSRQGADDILAGIEKMVDEFTPDISTKEGRQKIVTFNRKLANSKTTMIDMGKNLTIEWREKTKAVNSECNRIEAKFERWQEKVYKPFKDWKTKDDNRIMDAERRLQEIHNLNQNTDGFSKEILESLIFRLEELYKYDWQEFQERADGLSATINISINQKINNRIEQDLRDQELERLRKADAERQEQERITREAAEQLERQAKAKSELEALEKAAADKATKEAEEKAERDRKVAAEKAETDRKRLEQEKQDAIDKAAIDARKAQEDRIKAAEKAKRDIEAAAQAERDRISAEQLKKDKEESDRQANIAHRSKIHKRIALALQEEDESLTADQIKGIIIVIALGKIPGVKILY